MLNGFKLYNVYAESVEIKKSYIHIAKIGYVEYNRKEQPSNRVNLIPLKEIVKEGIDNYSVKIEYVKR